MFYRLVTLHCEPFPRIRVSMCNTSTRIRIKRAGSLYGNFTLYIAKNDFRILLALKQSAYQCYGSGSLGHIRVGIC